MNVLTSSPILTSLPPQIFQLISRPLPSLRIYPNKPYDQSIQALIAKTSLPNGVKAGLNLINDDFDGCHNISQDNDTIAAFQWWHAALHRREGDWSNSKYWYERVSHPLLEKVFPGSSTPRKIACDFVDLCSNAKPEEEEGFKEKQFEEMLTLLVWCMENGV